MIIQISNMHADAVGSYLTSQGRSWRIVARTGDHVEDVATCETSASRDEVQAAMDRSVRVRGDRCSAIDWLSGRRVGDGGEVRCGDLMGPHDGVRLCGACATASPDDRTIPCGDLIERVETTATIAQPDPAPATDTMTVGDDGAKGMPPGLAEEMAGMAPADRAVAQRVSDLAEIEPRPGYEDRAVARAKREGVLPATEPSTERPGNIEIALPHFPRSSSR